MRASERNLQETQPAANAAAPNEERLSAEESIQRQLAAYARQGYEPTHKICSVLGYMIGIEESRFLSIAHSVLERSIYDRADRNDSMRLVRLLCTLRDRVMRQSFVLKDKIYNKQTIQDEQLNRIRQRLHAQFGIDLSITQKTKTLGDYLIRINQEIRRALDAVQDKVLPSFLPDCVEASKIAGLVAFPGNVKGQKEAWELCERYRAAQNGYPWRYYINIDPGAFIGNPLSGDDQIVAYTHGSSFQHLWQLRTPYPAQDAYQTLHGYLDNTGNYTFCFLIDGVSVTVNEVLAILKALTQDELDMLASQNLEHKPILLYCCNDVFQNWRFYLGDFAQYIHPIEVSSTVRDPDRVEDIGVNCAISTFWLPQSTAILLVTRDKRVFKSCWEQAKAERRGRCLITGRMAEDDILDAVVKERLPYIFLEDFAPQELRGHIQTAEDVLQRQFPMKLKLNLHDILEEALLQIPINYSEAEKQKLYCQMKEGVQMQIGEDGSIRLLCGLTS